MVYYASAAQISTVITVKDASPDLAGPSISVVIPTLGRPALIARVLDRLGRQTADPGAFEVLVAADAKEERVEELEQAVAGRAYSARCIPAPRPGASAPRNARRRAPPAPP